MAQAQLKQEKRYSLVPIVHPSLPGRVSSIAFTEGRPCICSVELRSKNSCKCPFFVDDLEHCKVKETFGLSSEKWEVTLTKHCSCSLHISCGNIVKRFNPVCLGWHDSLELEKEVKKNLFPVTSGNLSKPVISSIVEKINRDTILNITSNAIISSSLQKQDDKNKEEDPSAFGKPIGIMITPLVMKNE